MTHIFLRYAPTEEKMVSRLNEVAEIDLRFAKQLIVEMARNNWLRYALVNELQQNSFQVGQVRLNGEEATEVARTACVYAWTIRIVLNQYYTFF